MASVYVLPTRLKGRDKDSIKVIQNTYDYVTSAAWGERYKDYFYFGVLDDTIHVVIAENG